MQSAAKLLKLHSLIVLCKLNSYETIKLIWFFGVAEWCYEAIAERV